MKSGGGDDGASEVVNLDIRMERIEVMGDGRPETRGSEELEFGR